MSAEAELPDRLLFDPRARRGDRRGAGGAVPTDFRTAVVLSDIEGLSYQEIADAVGVPIGTVRSRLARGRAMMRKALEGYARREGYLKEETTE